MWIQINEFNMTCDIILQVGDRLFSAFGQDTIDALFWTATEPRNSRGGIFGVGLHLFMAVVYVCILQNIDKPNFLRYPASKFRMSYARSIQFVIRRIEICFWRIIKREI